MYIYDECMVVWCSHLHNGEIMENTRNYINIKILQNRFMIELLANNNNGDFPSGLLIELRKMIAADGYVSTVNSARLEIIGGKKMILKTKYTPIDDEVIPELLIWELS